jgi:hypothetical protein
MSERYQRRDFGHLRIDVTFADPSAYAKPLTSTVNMELAADTEMIEAVCESGSDSWSGRSAGSAALHVGEEVLARYVGVYAGVWAGRPRTVEIAMSAGGLVAIIDGESFALAASSETLFESSEGQGYRFIVDGNGPATHVEEIHVSGDYRYARRR